MISKFLKKEINKFEMNSQILVGKNQEGTVFFKYLKNSGQLLVSADKLEKYQNFNDLLQDVKKDGIKEEGDERFVVFLAREEKQILREKNKKDFFSKEDGSLYLNPVLQKWLDEKFEAAVEKDLSKKTA